MVSCKSLEGKLEAMQPALPERISEEKGGQRARRKRDEWTRFRAKGKT